MNFSLKIIYFNLFGWVYFQNILVVVRGMSLTEGGVVQNCENAVRYIVAWGLCSLHLGSAPALGLCATKRFVHNAKINVLEHLRLL